MLSAKPIAECLVKAGFNVAVYDVLEAAMAAFRGKDVIACTSCADVAGRSDIVISLVRDGSETEEVIFGTHRILEALRPGTIFVTGSTVGPALVRRIAKVLSARGCEMLDMPFTGGYVAAYEGRLSLMVGGAQETIDRASPVLRAFAHVITRAGDVGAGQTAKLAHQLIMSMNIMALLEGLSLGVAEGIQPEIIRQIIRDGIANSGVLQVWDEMGPRWKRFLDVNEPGGAVPIMKKDLHLALDLACELGVKLSLGAQASRIADEGIATGRDNPLL